jgi:hypothetical protein
MVLGSASVPSAVNVKSTYDSSSSSGALGQHSMLCTALHQQSMLCSASWDGCNGDPCTASGVAAVPACCTLQCSLAFNNSGAGLTNLG